MIFRLHNLLISLRSMPALLWHQFWAYHIYHNTFLVSLLDLKGHKTKTFSHQVKMDFDLDLSPHVRLMYLGVYEYPVLHLLKRTLKPGDIFIDIGANIGYFSAIAASLVGQSGQVHAFEPDARYFSFLRQLADLNPHFHIYPQQLALGENNTRLKLFQTHQLGTSSLVKSLRHQNQILKTKTVPVMSFDNYVKKNITQPHKISLIKIDVEGFEPAVLKGMRRFLSSPANCPIIIVEVNPHAFKLQNYSAAQFQAMMRDYGYHTSPSVDLANLPAGSADVYNVVYYPNSQNVS